MFPKTVVPTPTTTVGHKKIKLLMQTFGFSEGLLILFGKKGIINQECLC